MMVIGELVFIYLNIIWFQMELVSLLSMEKFLTVLSVL